MTEKIDARTLTKRRRTVLLVCVLVVFCTAAALILFNQLRSPYRFLCSYYQGEEDYMPQVLLFEADTPLPGTKLICYENRRDFTALSWYRKSFSAALSGTHIIPASFPLSGRKRINPCTSAGPCPTAVPAFTATSA